MMVAVTAHRHRCGVDIGMWHEQIKRGRPLTVSGQVAKCIPDAEHRLTKMTYK